MASPPRRGERQRSRKAHGLGSMIKGLSGTSVALLVILVVGHFVKGIIGT